MSQEIKSITFEGDLEVWGIYNYNGPEERYDAQTNQRYKNHIRAKTFIINNKEIDYTSSRCLRHEIFKDLQPRQPSKKDFGDQFIKMAASEVGLLRGYLSPDDGLNRLSPLHIADARTIDETPLIVFDQGSSSKPKEKSDTKSDTSMFSKDNAPYRTQKLFGGINLKELQFLSLYDLDNDFSMIEKKDSKKFTELLTEYFKERNVDHALAIKKYVDIGAVYRNEREGILLNQEQIRHLVRVVFQRIKMIRGLKAGSRLAYKKNTLEVSFFDGEDSQDVKESGLKEALEGKSMNFYSFFKEV